MIGDNISIAGIYDKYAFMRDGKFVIISFLCVLLFIVLWFVFRSEEILKYIITVSSIIILFLLYSINRIWALYFIIFYIAFPIHLRLMNRDAITITSILIIILFLIEFSRKGISFSKYGKPIMISIILLLLTNTISIFQLSGDTLMVNLRSYAGFVVSLMLFFLVISMLKDVRQLKSIINIIYIFLLVQLAISFLLISNYDLTFLEVFATREYQFWTTTHRASGIVHDYELLAEWYAVFIPFAIWYMITGHKKIIHFIGIIMLFLGIFVTTTRGALLSLVVGLFLFIVLLPSKTIGQKIKNVALSIILILGLWFLSKNLAGDFHEKMFTRFQEAFETYEGGGTVSEVLNRQMIWELYFRKHASLNLFGTGTMHTPIGNLHSLYFTLQYQTGISGLLAFIIFLIIMIIKLVKAYRKHLFGEKRRILILVGFVSLAIFIIDEIKIEYIRASAFMQYVWLVFAMILVTTNYNLNEQNSDGRIQGDQKK